MNNPRTLLVTGSTGSLGKELLKTFLEKTSDQLLLLVRPKAHESQEKRVEKLLNKIGINGQAAGRIRVLAGDVSEPRLGLNPADWDLAVRETDEFYHSAALTHLGAARDEAEKINLRGTLNALELAREAKAKGKLKRFFYFSTAYVAGSLSPIHALEDVLPKNPVFSNAYEATKFEAEGKVREAMAQGLPATIFRPSIVVGDSETGAVSEFNVIYPFLRLFAHGLLRRVPAHPQHSFNIVPIDFVVEAAFHLARRPETLGKTFHLVTENPPTIKMLLEIKEEYGNFPPVELVAPESFSTENLDPEERAVFSALHPYLGYLNGSLTFDTANTREALRGSAISLPETGHAFLKKIVGYAIERGYFLRSA